MSNLKTNQWLIDRAYNMKQENADRTKVLLKCIHDIEINKYTKEEGLEIAVNNGVIPSPERYGRSTATGLKSYGLISSTYRLTNAGNDFISDKLNFKNLMLLQLIKKEHKFDNGKIVRPLLVTLNVLVRLLHIDKEQCWIDCYDYQEFLTELIDYSELDYKVTEIINARKKNERNPKYIINHFDIWINAFISTNLIVEINDSAKENIFKKYTLNFDELNFIKEIIAQEKCLSIIDNGTRNREEILEVFGMNNDGLYDMMPDFPLEEKIDIFNVEFDKKKVLEMYLFDGLSTRDIECEILGKKSDDYTKGWFGGLILHSLGINPTIINRGIWEPYKMHKDLIKMNPKYAHLNEIFEILFDNVHMTNVGYNKIFYGIPGCGKSYHVEHNVLKGVDKLNNVFRTTFYLDYSNSDFIGQIYPKVDGQNVTYENVPGPFTKALKRAFETPNEMIYLVIEEINRGNAAAIFGDTFQLLDRLEGNHDGRIPGDSEYPISNEFIENYLGDLVKKGQVYIPHNLTVLATMNTSDQNVFPLDTAFKRRWDLEKVVNDWSTCDLAKLCVPFTDITWENFAKTINVRMVQANEEGEVIINEDKKLGAYFATKDMLVEKEKRHDNTPENKAKLKKFVTNVVDYLFNDVTKFDHSTLFKEKVTFDDIYEHAISYVMTDHEIDVFHNIFKEKVEPDVKDD